MPVGGRDEDSRMLTLMKLISFCSAVCTICKSSLLLSTYLQGIYLSMRPPCPSPVPPIYANRRHPLLPLYKAHLLASSTQPMAYTHPSPQGTRRGSNLCCIYIRCPRYHNRFASHPSIPHIPQNRLHQLASPRRKNREQRVAQPMRTLITPL